MEASLITTFSPTEEDQAAIYDPLIAFNDSIAGPSDFERIAILLKDSKDNSVGGLWGKFSYNWLTIDFIIVPEDLRKKGWGRKLIDTAERAATDRSCVGIWLDTHGFQAPGFYKVIGYEIFGELPDYPKGFSRYFLRKLLPRN